VNDNPFAPISKFGRELVAEQGAGTPIAWLPRESRFVEKLARPTSPSRHHRRRGPIKAARGGHLLSDELTMHFGSCPGEPRHLRDQRAARPRREDPGGLFNIMQEGDVQVKGYPSA